MASKIKNKSKRRSVSFVVDTFLARKILLDPRLQVIKKLLRYADLQDFIPLGNSLVLIFERNLKGSTLIDWAVNTEIEENGYELATVLRTDSLELRTLAQYMVLTGSEYLKSFLGPFIVQVMKSPPLSDRKVSEATTTLVNTLVASTNRFPNNVVALCTKLMARIQEKYPNYRLLEALVGSFFMLRFILPGIVTPQKFGIINVTFHSIDTDTLTIEAHRALVAIAKRLQNLVSSVQPTLKGKFDKVVQMDYDPSTIKFLKQNKAVYISLVTSLTNGVSCSEYRSIPVTFKQEENAIEIIQAFVSSKWRKKPKSKPSKTAKVTSPVTSPVHSPRGSKSSLKHCGDPPTRLPILPQEGITPRTQPPVITAGREIKKKDGEEDRSKENEYYSLNASGGRLPSNPFQKHMDKLWRVLGRIQREKDTNAILVSGLEGKGKYTQFQLVQADAIGRQFNKWTTSFMPSPLFASKLSYQFGYWLGFEDAHALTGLEDDPLKRLHMCFAYMGYTGWSRISVEPETRASNLGEELVMVYTLEESAESTSWEGDMCSEGPVCCMASGYVSGWASQTSQTPIVSTELHCIAQGNSSCRFLAAPAHMIHQRVKELRISKYPNIKVYEDTSSLDSYTWLEEGLPAIQDEFFMTSLSKKKQKSNKKEKTKQIMVALDIKEYFLKVLDDVLKGIQLHPTDPNTRWILIRADSVSHLIPKLIHSQHILEKKVKQSYIKNLEVDWGLHLGKQGFYHSVYSMQGSRAFRDSLAAFELYLTLSGMGKVTTIVSEYSPKLLIFQVEASAEGGKYSQGNTKHEEPHCRILAGYISGWFQEVWSTSISTVEVECITEGNPTCLFIAAAPHKIEQFIKIFLAGRGTLKEPLKFCLLQFWEDKKGGLRQWVVDN